jgi:hypothetical protein
VSQLFPGKEITLDTRCLQSGDPIHVRMRGWDVLEVRPKEVVGYVNTPMDKWGEPSWAYT